MWIQINQTVFTPDAIIPSHLQMRYFHGVTNTLYMTRNGVGLWSENCANAHSQQVAHWNQTPIYKFICVENEPHWVESFYLFSMHENCLRTKHVQFVRIVSNEAKWICLDWFFRPHNEKRALGQCRQHGKVRLKVKYKTHNSKFKLMNLGRAQFEFFFSSYFANNDARCYRRATTTMYTYQYEWCREDNELSRKNLQSKICGNLMKCPPFLWIFVLVQMQRKKDCKNFTSKTDDKAHKWLKTPFSKWI